ncbi:hypothetical protein DFJ58DRAFT_914712 [Suillus subalutaceus]|uniref:uncharacterized protein n=1 Tax=Suillus subalutaceus TaxID=48586 RepID=UPI001B8673CC|nr:uncharacterized protein DFJ58DRAFT_914712 [Suillus subalutaceus]KAG1850381.1 hypothetical protein DFJ58DRAFT_914712 [Suillus subalutaceus]
MLWHELLEHGGEPFDLYFSPIRDARPSLTLKVAVVQTRGNPLLHATYDLPNKNVAELTNALELFSSFWTSVRLIILTARAALTNLAWAAFKGTLARISKTSTLLYLYSVTPLYYARSVTPDHVYYLTEALTRPPTTAASIGETAQLYYELLPLCFEGTYLRKHHNCVGYVIGQCNNLPIDVSDKGIHLRRIVLKLCQVPTGVVNAISMPSPSLQSRLRTMRQRR